MNNDINNINELSDTAPTLSTPLTLPPPPTLTPPPTPQKPLELNMEYVLSRIDIILNDTTHIHQALDTILQMKPSESEYQGGQSDGGRAEAVATTVQSRETTNQQMIKLLEKMYDDLKPKAKNIKDRAFDLVERKMNNASLTEDEKSDLTDILDAIRHIDK